MTSCSIILLPRYKYQKSKKKKREKAISHYEVFQFMTDTKTGCRRQRGIKVENKELGCFMLHLGHIHPSPSNATLTCGGTVFILNNKNE